MVTEQSTLRQPGRDIVLLGVVPDVRRRLQEWRAYDSGRANNKPMPAYTDAERTADEIYKSQSMTFDIPVTDAQILTVYKMIQEGNGNMIIRRSNF
jgi:hypothetical protein